MRIFRRNTPVTPESVPEEPSLEEIEENPELLAAEAAVNELPPPPPSGTSWVQGAGAKMVTFPGPEPDEEVEDLDEAPRGSGTTDDGTPAR